jgi:predicted dehydrogenase
MRKLRIGLIGTGLIVRGAHLPALHALTEYYEIAAVCSGHRENAAALAAEIGGSVAVSDSPDEMLARDDVEAVDIATPITLNRPLSEAAAAAGKHIFLEKPIAGNVRDGVAVAALGEKYGIVLLVAETHRYMRAYSMAREILDTGEIGERRVLHWDDLSMIGPENKYSQTAWRQNPEHVGGYLSDGGVHAAASVTIVGGRVSSLHALTASFNPSLLGEIDTMLVNMKFASGFVGNLNFSVGTPESHESPLTLYCSNGRMEIDRDKIVIAKADTSRVIDVPDHDPFVHEFRNFYEAVVEGVRPLGTAEGALDDLRFVEAAILSAEVNGPVSLDDTGK